MECCVTLDVFRVRWLQSHIIYSIKTASYHPIYKKNPFYSRVTIKKKSLTCNIKLYYKNMAWHNYHSVWIWYGNTECRQYRADVLNVLKSGIEFTLQKTRDSSCKKRILSCKKRVLSWQKRVSSCKKRVSSWQKRVSSCKKRVSNWQKRVSSC